MLFTPIDPTLFFSRQDPNDPRLGELIQAQPLKTAEWILAGYPDDEGVNLNFGRVGAKDGPDAIRNYLYRMTPHAFSDRVPSCFDRGNLAVHQLDLRARHEEAYQAAHTDLINQQRCVRLGGGHDYAYSDGTAFLDWCAQNERRGLILNFDAHLDVRPYDKAPNSGTSFRRLTEHPADKRIVQIGIQSQCNSRAHVAWAKQHGVHIISWDEIECAGPNGLAELVLGMLSEALVKRDPTFISVDMDGFALPWSAGTSAPSTVGFQPSAFLPVWETLRSRLDVRVAGFYENAPVYDPQHHTARLAALLIHRMIAC